MDATTIGTALSNALSATKNMLGVVADISALPTKKENVDLTNMLRSLLDSLSQAKNEESKLIAEKKELERIIKQYENWFDNIKPNYRLIELARGVFVYTQREPEQAIDGTDNPHCYLCTRCFGNRRESILQSPGYGQNGRLYKCPECGFEYNDHNDRPPTYDPTVPNKRRNKWGV